MLFVFDRVLDWPSGPNPMVAVPIHVDVVGVAARLACLSVCLSVACVSVAVAAIAVAAGDIFRLQGRGPKLILDSYVQDYLK